VRIPSIHRRETALPPISGQLDRGAVPRRWDVFQGAGIVSENGPVKPSETGEPRPTIRGRIGALDQSNLFRGTIWQPSGLASIFALSEGGFAANQSGEALSPGGLVASSRHIVPSPRRGLTDLAKDTIVTIASAPVPWKRSSGWA